MSFWFHYELGNELHNTLYKPYDYIYSWLNYSQRPKTFFKFQNMGLDFILSNKILTQWLNLHRIYVVMPEKSNPQYGGRGFKSDELQQTKADDM